MRALQAPVPPSTPHLRIGCGARCHSLYRPPPPPPIPRPLTLRRLRTLQTKPAYYVLGADESRQLSFELEQMYTDFTSALKTSSSSSNANPRSNSGVAPGGGGGSGVGGSGGSLR